jgi:hypothetical protein
METLEMKAAGSSETLLPTRLHDIKPHNLAIFTGTTTKTSNLIQYFISNSSIL